MKILLVLPASEAFRVRSPSDPVPKRKMLRFSVLSLTTVAALTPPEHTVSICDENVEILDLETDADVVGITFMTALAPRAYEIARAFRARGRKVVAGGFHPTFLPEESASHFDSVIVGDAETLWPQCLADIEAGQPRRIYRHSAPPDLAATPSPRRDLTAKTERRYATTGAVQTGRGCRHRCSYCSITAFHGGTHRSRPLENVIAELKALPRNMMFVDDNIIADREYARRLFRAMAPMKKRWVSQCSLEIADDTELLSLARRAGCYGFFIGVETSSAENLAAVGKTFIAARRTEARIAAIRRAGIGVIAGMIVGMDADGRGVFRNTLRFLQRARIDALQLNIMTPLPGTPLFDELDGAGRIIDRDWSRYDFRHVVIEPKKMAARELQDGADWLITRFYRLDQILQRFARSLFTLGLMPAWLALKLNLTYRGDVRRLSIRGRDPATGTIGRAGRALARLHCRASQREGLAGPLAGKNSAAFESGVK
jgi:radical SAM superfamily enzyme YgiQ (UPF0313 family)